MHIENICDERICLWTEKGSVAELDRWPSNLFETLNCELTEPVFWFCRLKAKVEGEGEGTKLMTRLVQILDEKQITVVNGVNPYGSMSMDELKDFYRKYGFEDIGNDIMIRYPCSVTGEHETLRRS